MSPARAPRAGAAPGAAPAAGSAADRGSGEAAPLPSGPGRATLPSPPWFVLDDEACRRHAARSGTPCFVYHGPTLGRAFTALRAALPPRAHIAYAVKANPHPTLLANLAALGASFDVASVGELRRVAALGLPGGRVLFTGPGKRTSELQLALSLGARVNAEGWEDVQRLDALAAGLGLGAPPHPLPRLLPVNLRVHPLRAADEERPLIGGAGPSAFGVDEEDLPAFLARCAALRHVRISGLHVFAASNQRDAGRLLAAHEHAFAIGRRLQHEHGLPLDQIDLGGGLGVPYAAGEAPLDLDAFGRGLQRLLDGHRWFTGELILEPGRWLAASCGTYLVRVVSTKASRGVRFAILEGGINHLLRPALTGQPFPVRRVPPAEPRRGRPGSTAATPDPEASPPRPVVLAGPLCTSLDRLGEALLPELVPGDLLAFGMTGAYGFTESMPGFLSHPVPPEIWID